MMQKGVSRVKFFDGRAAAEILLADLAETVRSLAKIPRLGLVFFGSQDALNPFLREKVRACEKIGAECRLYPISESASASRASAMINSIAREAHTDGIVIQLPLPKQLDDNRQGLFRILPEEKDIDCLSERWFGRMQTGRTNIQMRRSVTTLTPPVVAAISHILESMNINLRGKRVLILGWGDLVGKPSTAWFLHQGATVITATSTEQDRMALGQIADIIVSGVGKPGTITADMVRRDALVFDAGTSDASGKVLGDVAADVTEKAALVTPVPGGIGPLAVAMLMRNLVSLVAAEFGKKG